jgi:hypothetical protein
MLHRSRPPKLRSTGRVRHRGAAARPCRRPGHTSTARRSPEHRAPVLWSADHSDLRHHGPCRQVPVARAERLRARSPEPGPVTQCDDLYWNLVTPCRLWTTHIGAQTREERADHPVPHRRREPPHVDPGPDPELRFSATMPTTNCVRSSSGPSTRWHIGSISSNSAPASLGVMPGQPLTADQARQVVADCNDYFDRNPMPGSSRWTRCLARLSVRATPAAPPATSTWPSGPRTRSGGSSATGLALSCFLPRAGPTSRSFSAGPTCTWCCSTGPRSSGR